MTWFRDDWLMIQSAEKKYDESKNFNDSKTDVDFNWICLSLSESFWDVKIDVWWEIEKDAVQKTTNSTSTIMKFCMSVVHWWLEVSWKNLIWCDNYIAQADINLSDIKLMKR